MSWTEYSRSAREMTLTSDVALRREMSSFPMGGTMMRRACGSVIRKNV
jgi:hypothetical protein